MKILVVSQESDMGSVEMVNWVLEFEVVLLLIRWGLGCLRC